MSLSSTPLRVALVQEPILDVDAKATVAVLKAPSTVSWQQFPASSFNGSTLSITANQPDRKTLIDRRVYLQLQLTFAFAGTVPGGNVPLLNIGVSDGFRAYPILSTLNGMTMKIGGKAITAGSMDQYWPFMLRYHNPVEQRKTDYSITAAMMDSFQTYQQGIGTNRNPLGAYGDNTDEIARGGFTLGQITNYVDSGLVTAAAGAATASFNVVLNEPLFLSPFLFAKGDDEKGLLGVDTFNFTCTFDALSRMWSRCNLPGGSQILPGTAGHSITVTSTASGTGASLLFRQITPSPTTNIPKEISYNYFNTTLYPANAAAPVAVFNPQTGIGGLVKITSSLISLAGIPRRIYVWVAPQFQTWDWTTTDTMYRINQITVKWGTKTYLAEATEVDLYNIAKKNGYCGSWTEWRYFTGGVLCLDMGSDIGLLETEAAGSEGKFQIQFVIQATRLSTALSVIAPATTDIAPSIYVLAVQEGIVDIKAGTVYVNENVVSGHDVMNAKPMPGVTYKKSLSIYGGSFFSDLLSGVNKVAGIAQQVLPYASMIPGIGKYADAASKVAGVAKALTGGRRRMAQRGGAAIGGRRVIGVGSRRHARHGMRGRGFDDEDGKRGAAAPADYNIRDYLVGGDGEEEREENVGSEDEAGDALDELAR